MCVRNPIAGFILDSSAPNQFFLKYLDKYRSGLTDYIDLRFERTIVPQILELAPWTGDYMFVASDAGKKRKALFKGVETNVMIL